MRIAAAALLSLPAGLAGCGGEGGSAGERATVVATTPQLADIAAAVAGARAEVVGILPANADPHDYEPAPSDAAALADATLVVRSGGDVDEWVDELAESTGADGETLVVLDYVATIEGGHEHEGEAPQDEEEHAEEEVDPHWWQDPRNAALAAEELASRLGNADPEGAEEYEANAAAYRRQVATLDRAIADCMRRIPAERRKLVTSHDSLGYFAERYGLEVVGAALPALTTQAQPSAGAVDELVRLIRAENAPAVFPEAGLPADLERAIAQEAGAAIGGELYADALGPPGSPGEHYLGAMAANARTLAGGLTAGEVACELPAE